MTALEILLALDPCRKASAPISSLLTLAEAETGTAYGANRPKAVALLALHWLALQERGRGGAAGPIISESEGDLSRTYGQPMTSGAKILESTSWGQELLRLRRQSFIAGGMRTRADGC
jgi:hypothetical protein